MKTVKITMMCMANYDEVVRIIRPSHVEKDGVTLKVEFQDNQEVDSLIHSLNMLSGVNANLIHEGD